MATAVYLLCTATSALCAVLLLRHYRLSRTPLLFWSGVAFSGLAVSNALVFADYVVFPSVDLAPARSGVALASIVVLVYGLVWDGR